MTDKLLPCQFCGAAPEKDGYGYYHLGNESRVIHCVNPLCPDRPAVTQFQDEYGEWSLEDAWNCAARAPKANAPR